MATRHVEELLQSALWEAGKAEFMVEERRKWAVKDALGELEAQLELERVQREKYEAAMAEKWAPTRS
jgi:hypothetical protein